MPLSTECATRRVDCTHCGLDVPGDLRTPGESEQFCCGACRTVYTAIHSAGLEAFYGLQADDERQRAVVSGRNYGPFDEPAFHARHVTEAPDGTRHARLYLEGVHCGACVWLAERLPQILEGVIVSRLDLGRQVLDVAWRPERVALSRIAATLDGLGYPAHPWSEDRRDALRRHEQRTALIRIGVAGACAGNAMLIAFALYGGALGGMDPRFESLFRWASAALTLIALFWPGRVFLRGALSSLRTGVMHMDLPVAIALVAGTAWGISNTVRGVGEVYFESMTAVIFLLLVGRWVQSRQQRAAQDAVSLLFSLTPSTALRLGADGDEEIAVESLATGDRVRVRAGDEVPVDGVILSGSTELDLSLLTGESAPVSVGAGDPVHAGTQNLSAPIVVETRATGAETRAGQPMQQVERFARERPPLVRLADRVAHVFVITVLLLALATALGWWSFGADTAIERAITLLIVTCPCALGLATPLALLAAIGRAAERGILIKGGEVIERLARPGRMWIDKTGTLTRGDLRLVDWRGDASLEPLVVALERDVRHPVAQALVTHFGPESTARVDDAHAEVGRGVSGHVDGRSVRIGRPQWVADVAQVPEWVGSMTAELESRALSTVWVAVDGRVRGVAGLGDTLREDAPRAMAQLRALGWEASILSGDRRAVVDPVARELGLAVERAQADATPEEKVDQVRRSGAARERRPIFGRDRPVVMVGDGVNDAAALAAADVGIAVEGGAPASLGAADVFMRREGLSPLVELVAGSRRVVAVIRRNIAISIGYNLVAGTLAIAGVIDPMIAAILMPFSSLTVVACSYRSRTFQAER